MSHPNFDIKTIKHFSFDLWFTLIKSNPQFKKERANFFFLQFNSLEKTLTQVEEVFRNVDLQCNAINEKTGNNITAEEMYLMVIYQLNDGNEYFCNLNLVDLYNQMELLILNYPPTLFCNQTKNVLKTIKEKKGISTNILSNTAFVKGCTLKKVLQHLDIDMYFDFQLYSDEVNLSKPNSKLYDLLFDTIIDYRKNELM